MRALDGLSDAQRGAAFMCELASADQRHRQERLDGNANEVFPHSELWPRTQGTLSLPKWIEQHNRGAWFEMRFFTTVTGCVHIPRASGVREAEISRARDAPRILERQTQARRDRKRQMVAEQSTLPGLAKRSNCHWTGVFLAIGSTRKSVSQQATARPRLAQRSAETDLQLLALK